MTVVLVASPEPAAPSMAVVPSFPATVLLLLSFLVDVLLPLTPVVAVGVVTVVVVTVVVPAAA